MCKALQLLTLIVSLLGYMCLLSSEVHAFYHKVNVSPTGKCWMYKVFIGNWHLVTKETIVKEFQSSNFHAILPALTCISSVQCYRLLFLQMNVSPTWKLWHIGGVTLTSSLSSQRQTVCKTLEFPTLIVSFHGKLVSLPFSNIVLFTVKWKILCLINTKGRKYFFEIQTKFSKGNIL
jgi:hypothetical protein